MMLAGNTHRAIIGSKRALIKTKLAPRHSANGHDKKLNGRRLSNDSSGQQIVQKVVVSGMPAFWRKARKGTRSALFDLSTPPSQAPHK